MHYALMMMILRNAGELSKNWLHRQMHIAMDGQTRVAQNFKHEKFMWDQADSYSLRKRNAEKCKNCQNPTTFKGSR